MGRACLAVRRDGPDVNVVDEGDPLQFLYVVAELVHVDVFGNRFHVDVFGNRST